jgi:hypothetical protein
VSIPSFRDSNPNAKSPDVPGGVDIALGRTDVSPVIPRIIEFVIASEAKQSILLVAIWIASLRSQ